SPRKTQALARRSCVKRVEKLQLGQLVSLPAEKRLSNEFADTTGWAPATRLFEAAGAAAGAGVSAAVSVTAGLSAGLAGACLVAFFAGLGLRLAALGL